MVMLHIKLKGSRMQQHGRKYFGLEPPPTPSNPGGQKVKIQFCTEHYHIKLIDSRIQKHNSKFSAYIPSPYPLDLCWGVKGQIQLIENMVMLHMKAATCKYFGRRSPLPAPPTLWSKVNLFRTWSCCISN